MKDRTDEEQKLLMADTIDDLLDRPDPIQEYEKRQMIDLLVMDAIVMMLLFVVFSTMNISLVMLTGIGCLAIGSCYVYLKQIKKQEAIKGKLFIDSVTYLGDSSFIEQEKVLGYELIENDEIGVMDDELHVVKVHGEDGNDSYYVSKVPLYEEMFSPTAVITPYGISEGIGVSYTSRIIDVIYDPETGKKIPVKQVLSSPALSQTDIVELDPIIKDQIQIKPISVEVPNDKNLKVQKLVAWEVVCSHCGGRLNIDKIQNTSIGQVIHCEYCGTDNGIRVMKK